MQPLTCLRDGGPAASPAAAAIYTATRATFQPRPDQSSLEIKFREEPIRSSPDRRVSGSPELHSLFAFRGDSGMRACAATGEHYLQTTGEQSGLWRNRGRARQKPTGTYQNHRLLRRKFRQLRVGDGELLYIYAGLPGSIGYRVRLIRESSCQSNAIARRPRRAIQQTMASNARVRPTSGQTRSSAINTTPHPCFVAPPLGDAFSFAACPMGGGVGSQRALI